MISRNSERAQECKVHNGNDNVNVKKNTSEVSGLHATPPRWQNRAKKIITTLPLNGKMG